MDPATLDALTALISGDPQRIAMALDGLMILGVPVVGRAYVAAVNRRPRKGAGDARRAIYAARKKLIKALPVVLVLLCAAIRVLLALYLDLDVATEAFRGVGVALAGVGAHEFTTSPARVRTAELDTDAAPDGR